MFKFSADQVRIFLKGQQYIDSIAVEPFHPKNGLQLLKLHRFFIQLCGYVGVRGLGQRVQPSRVFLKIIIKNSLGFSRKKILLPVTGSKT